LHEKHLILTKNIFQTIMKISSALKFIGSIAIFSVAYFACNTYSSHKAVSTQVDTPAVFAQANLPVQEAPQQKSSGDDVSNSRRNAITNTVAKASPAVVGINVTEVRQVQAYDPFEQLFQNDPFFNQYFNRRGGRTFQQEVKSLGSGFIISPDGYIVTNSHVAGNATKIVVTMTDGRKLDAKLIGADPLLDVALLKVTGTNLPFLKLGNSDDVIVGEWAIAFGNPFGLFDINDKPTVTVGVVSSTGLNFPDLDGKSYKDMIQTDASINSGNSGGPLLNANAEVIGMNTFIYTGGGQGSIGIGFSIPINRVKKITDELKKNGKIDRSFKTGLSIQTLDANLSRYFGIKDVQGVVVSNVEKNSAAERAGLAVGDVITQINGEKVRVENDVILATRESRAGDVLKLSVIRDRKPIEVNLTLER
jgi:serine protease Do